MVDDAKLPFGAVYAYHTVGDLSELARMREGLWVREHVKKDRPVRAGAPPPSQQIADRIVDHVDSSVFGGAIGRAEWLVPVPSGSPKPSDSLWVPRRIAQALVDRGLGQAVVPCLVRRHSVKRVPRARSRSERPTITEHAQSLEFDGPRIPMPTSVVLVDDVVTSGSTALACAAVLRGQLGSMPIFLVAAVRAVTEPRPPGHQFVSPVTGWIHRSSDDRGSREP